MGLELQEFVNKNGYLIESGYYELTRIEYDFAIHLLSFNGEIYLSKECKDNGFYPIDAFEDGIEVDKIPQNIERFVYDYIIQKGKEAEKVEDFKYKGFINCKEVD